MSVYVIARQDIRDPDGYARYQKLGAPTVPQYGGEVVAYGDADVMHGDWPGRRTTVVRFASADDARRWYDSPEYRAARVVRDAATTTDVVIVEGRS